MKYFVKYNKEEDKFKPVSDKDFNSYLKMNDGQYFEVKGWKERNVNFLRKYFALINCGIHHLPEHQELDRFRDVDYFRKYLQILIGKCEVIVGLSGKENYSPISISFDKMDEEEFQDLYSKTLDAILRYFLNMVPRHEFENDILNFMR